MKLAEKHKNKAGFTLIEVIAVLVILAVLAAVAVPRYLDLIDEARTRALEGALAAGLSHASLAYARLALENGVAPTAAEVAADCTANDINNDDYSFTFVAVAGPPPGVNVTATDEDDASITDTLLWELP